MLMQFPGASTAQKEDKVTLTDPVTASDRNVPRMPRLTAKDILFQLRADVYGKEVQSATTYSYTWMADQVGHVCIGIVFDFLLTLAARYALPYVGVDSYWWSSVTGFLLICAIVTAWEFSTYRSSVDTATGLFPLDSRLLRDNAIIASVYMILGAVIGFSFHLPVPWSIIGTIAAFVVGFACAPPWLRQKIIWQKAALPYLFRLADAQRTIGPDDAHALQKLIDRGAPPNVPPYQIIVGGPIGSGRTPIAAGIGTEFAFRKSTVRYLSLDPLLEHAAQPPNPHFADDTGPANINYWRWSEAQVVIIDDIGPLIATQEREQRANLEQFRNLLNTGLAAIAPVLARCHTVWVIGDLHPEGQTIVGPVLDEFARVISDFCQGGREALVIELANMPDTPDPSAASDALSLAPPVRARQRARAGRTGYVTNVRTVTW
jgi:hypothetical protein